MPRFGTDGIRGVANEVVTPELALALGRAAVAVMGPRVAIARDTRLSGPMIEAALIAGICSAGGDAVRCGVLPTPGLSAVLAASPNDLDGGIMITASHNPPGDNGLKALGRGGAKLDGGSLDRLASALDDPPPNGRIGAIRDLAEPVGVWLSAVRRAGPGGGVPWLQGRKVVLDAGNGAGGVGADALLESLGATVVAIGHGTGELINVGAGAMSPGAMVAAVRRHRADVGIALDGDADRVVLADAGGELLDGDDLLWLCADGPTVVGTVMCNGGLEESLSRRGIRLIRTKVGDAHVAAAMRSHHANLGGEPSGHVLFSDGLPTSDGLLTALRAIYPDPRALRSRLAGFERRAVATAAVAVPAEAVARCTFEIAELEEQGARVVVRASGTEPVVRVLVEHHDPTTARHGVERLCALLKGAG